MGMDGIINTFNTKGNPNIDILEFAQKVEIWSEHHSNLSMDKTHKVHAAYKWINLKNS